MAKQKQKGPRRRAERFTPDPLLANIRIAGEQIDSEPGGRLGWVVGFVREDPSKWLPGDKDAHGYRLLALVYGPVPESVLQLGASRMPPISSDSVDAAHAELSALLRQLVRAPAGELVPISTDGLAEALIRATKPPAPGEKPRTVWGQTRGGPRRTLLLQAVKALVLGPLGERLAACPQCHEPFLALHKMRFCDKTCRQTHHDSKRPKKGEAR